VLCAERHLARRLFADSAVGLKRLWRNAEELCFYIIRIADYSALENLGRAGDISQPFGDISRRAGFGSRYLFALFFEQSDNALFDAVHVGAVYDIAEPAAYLINYRRAHSVRLVGGFRLRGYPQPHLAAFCIRCDGRILCVEHILYLFGDRALAHADYIDRV